MPDSVSCRFGALESEMRWSKLFLVTKNTRKIQLKKNLSEILRTWCPVKGGHTQQFLGVGVGGLTHVQAHGLPGAGADLAHRGVVVRG